jgi:hypothetical protein
VNSNFPNDQIPSLSTSETRWGWTIGPFAGKNNGKASTSSDLTSNKFVANIYAGAAQCDVCKGRYVGYISVSTGTDNSLTLKVFFSNNVSGTEFHVYIGTTPVPVVGGKATLAPGQYTYNLAPSDFTPISGGLKKVFYNIPSNDDWWFIFHTVTSGCGCGR